MACSSCEKFAEIYGFQSMIIVPTMSKITEDSSSEDETGSIRRLAVTSNSSTPLIIDTSSSSSNVKNSGATVGNSDDDNDEVSQMLDKVMEAVRESPTDDTKKGVSIFAIKKYLRLQHRVRKAQIIQQLRPAMEAALNRKLLVKVSGSRSILVGSVKLNPAHSRKPGSYKSYEDDEADAEPVVAKALRQQAEENRKRKAGGDETARSARVTKRLKA